MRFIFKIFMFFVFLLVFSQGTAVSGTVDNATLSPSGSVIQNRKAQEITFSAMNDQPFALKDYYVKIKYDGGLSVTGLTVSPPAVKAEISAKRNLIEIKWEGIQPNTELKATFNASNSIDVYNATYNITPQGILFHDYNRNRYAGTCNAVTIVVRAELIPPSGPKNVNSVPGDGYIRISWDPNTEADISGYDVYRSADSISYAKIGSTQDANLSDAGVNDGSTYYYKVMAVDKFGNESEFSIATAETYKAINIKTYDSPGAAVAATGDINGDGKADLVLGYPNANRHKYTAIGRVDIFYGGSTSVTPDMTIYGEKEYDRFGYSLTITDLNSDGYGDLIVGAPYYSEHQQTPGPGPVTAELGKVYVYSGADQLSFNPVLTILGEWHHNKFWNGYTTDKLGYSVSPAGDVNRDGYQDVLIGAPDGAPYAPYGPTMYDLEYTGKVTVLLGGPIISYRGFHLFGINSDEHMGYSATSAGDINADGFVDLVAGGKATYSTNGTAYLFYGGINIEVPDVVFGGPNNYGKAVAGLDMNGDGYSDIAVASEGSLSLYYGPNVSNSPDVVFSHSGSFISSLGDINRDGYEDLVSGGPLVCFGSSTGDNVADISRIGVNIKIIGVGDIDNDDVKDVVAADPDKVYIYSLARYLGLPEIMIFTPKANSATGLRDITINGAIKGNVVKLFIGGQQVPLSPDGLFSTLVSLSEGFNIIEIIAETPDGKISKRTLNVRYSSQITPLTVSITSPADGTTMNSTPITVTGTVNGPSPTVAVNGVKAAVSGSTFTAGLNLKEGPNTITAVATDSYGQTASHSITVTLLARGTVTGTVTDSFTGLPVSNVSVTVADFSETHTAATDSGGAYTISGITQGSFTAVFEKAGYVKQTINSTISAGQILSLNVQLAPVPPLNITIASPQDGAVVSSSPITIAGDVNNNANVTINGIRASVNGSTFSASIPLIEGQNTIMAVAADQYGQSVSKSIRVTLSTKGILTGTVTDSLTGLPLSQATVSVNDSLNITQTTLTDNDGRYTMAGIANGMFTGSITKTGYAAYPVSGTISAGQTTTANASLSLISPTISSITVSNVIFGSATITWKTDQPSDSLAEYGATTAYGSSVTDAMLTTNHSVTLTGLAPSTTYHFRVASKNSYGSSSTSIDNTFTTPGVITLTITSPYEGSTLSRPDLTVTGAITNAAGNETGVTVNGKVAYVYGGQFTAGHVPLAEGSNTITVTATDTSGNTATTSITVNAATSGNYVRLTSNMESGIAPLEATLTIGSTSPVSDSYVTYQGPGPVEFISMTRTEYRVKMTVEGIYYFTADVTGTDGNVYQDTVALTVMDKAKIDALLKGKWEGMKGALKNKDTEEAMDYFIERSKERYRGIFEALKDQLPVIMETFIEFNITDVYENVAEYEIVANENGVLYSYPGLFIKDGTGIWKFKDF